MTAAIYEGEKNKMGRVVCLSNDAVFCRRSMTVANEKQAMSKIECNSPISQEKAEYVTYSFL